MPRKKKEYTNESIVALKGPDKVRLRPGIIFGSNDLDGCTHSFFEILSNSVDEAREGHGNLIEVFKHEDGSFTIRDHGRGVPLDYNKKEKRYNWDLVYNELYAGGKIEGGNYSTSIGLNGIGATATQYASKWFDVVSVRDGYRYHVHFEKGIIQGDLEKKRDKTSETGTTQSWLPDDEVFTEIDIPSDTIRNILKTQAIVNAGIKFIFTDETAGTTEEFLYPSGIFGYVKELGEGKEIVPALLFEGSGRGRDREDKNDYDLSVQIAFSFCNSNQTIQYYHNSSPLEYGGAPDKAVRTAFVDAFDDYFRKTGKYSKNEAGIVFDDIKDCLILVSSAFQTSEEVSYENQTKKSINNKFVQDWMTDFLREKLTIWLQMNADEAKLAGEQILINKRSRSLAETQRQATKKKLMSKIGFTNPIPNFVDCRSKDPNERELFIAEGLSALGGIKLSRNSDFQAIIAIRGKILNCSKAPAKKILASDIIMNLIRVLGCDMHLTEGKKTIGKFDINKLRYNKVVIMSDQDDDGFQIRCLVLTMLYRLCPELIRQGYVYIAETPLFKITYKDGRNEKVSFAFTEAERDKLIKGKDENKLKIQRSKGLGENDVHTMAIFLDPATRHLTRVTIKDAKRAEDALELFMGDDVAPRRKYIEENGHKYMNDLDVS